MSTCGCADEMVFICVDCIDMHKFYPHLIRCNQLAIKRLVSQGAVSLILGFSGITLLEDSGPPWHYGLDVKGLEPHRFDGRNWAFLWSCWPPSGPAKFVARNAFLFHSPPCEQAIPARDKLAWAIGNREWWWMVLWVASETPAQPSDISPNVNISERNLQSPRWNSIHSTVEPGLANFIISFGRSPSDTFELLSKLNMNNVSDIKNWNDMQRSTLNFLHFRAEWPAHITRQPFWSFWSIAGDSSNSHGRCLRCLQNSPRLGSSTNLVDTRSVRWDVFHPFRFDRRISWMAWPGCGTWWPSLSFTSTCLGSVTQESWQRCTMCASPAQWQVGSEYSSEKPSQSIFLSIWQSKIDVIGVVWPILASDEVMVLLARSWWCQVGHDQTASIFWLFQDHWGPVRFQELHLKKITFSVKNQNQELQKVTISYTLW